LKKVCDQVILIGRTEFSSLKIGVDRGISPIRSKEGAQGVSPSKGTIGFPSETSALVFFDLLIISVDLFFIFDNLTLRKEIYFCI
jgi:hypothetical protein